VEVYQQNCKEDLLFLDDDDKSSDDINAKD